MPYPDHRGDDRTKRRQVFIHGHLQERKVEPGLGAAIDTLLGHPVAQGTHQSGEEPLPVGEERGVKNGKNAVEHGHIHQPGPGFPQQSQGDRDHDHNHQGNGGMQDAGLGVIQGIPA